jgi:thioesterase domain-containing protein
MLGAHQPVTVIPPHGLAGRPPATSVEEMAQDVAAIVERLHPTGPLRIGGYSAAGLVAYETARILRKRGRSVLDLVLIGTSAERQIFRRFARVADILPIPIRQRRKMLAAGMVLVLRALRFRRMSPADRDRKLISAFGTAGLAGILAPNEIEVGHDYRKYAEAHDDYVPERYEGNLTVLWPTSEAILNGDLERDWREIAARVHIVGVPGTHHGCVSRHLGDIADELHSRFV